MSLSSLVKHKIGVRNLIYTNSNFLMYLLPKTHTSAAFEATLHGPNSVSVRIWRHTGKRLPFLFNVKHSCVTSVDDTY